MTSLFSSNLCTNNSWTVFTYLVSFFSRCSLPFLHFETSAGFYSYVFHTKYLVILVARYAIWWASNFLAVLHLGASTKPGIILCMRSAYERRRYIVTSSERRRYIVTYIVTSSLIGWAHTQDDPCKMDNIVQMLFLIVFSWFKIA